MGSEGTYPTNGEKIRQLREKLGFKRQKDFCKKFKYPPPTLKRAESGGPCYPFTLEKLAELLKAESWMGLVADSAGPFSWPFTPALVRDLISPKPYLSFDQTSDVDDIRNAIENVLRRNVPFQLLLIEPHNSTLISAMLHPWDARALDIAFELGLFEDLLLSINHPSPRMGGTRDKTLQDLKRIIRHNPILQPPPLLNFPSASGPGGAPVIPPTKPLHE